MANTPLDGASYLSNGTSIALKGADIHGEAQ